MGNNKEVADERQQFLTHVARLDRSKFKDYLVYRYSETTINLYLWAYDKYAKNLYNQEKVNTFLIQKVYSTSNNPFYKGFLKALIDCFGLPYQIVKSKRRSQTKHKEYKFLTHEQIEKMIAGLPPYYSLLVQVYFDTGLRLRELFNVKRTDIDMKARTLSGIGKNGRPFCVKFSEDTRERLLRYAIAREKAGLKGQMYVFRTGKDIKDHARSFWYYLKKHCMDLGIPGVHPHRIRHALGHYLSSDLSLGIDKIRVKLRHVKLDTTAIYTGTTQEEVDAEIEQLQGGKENE